MNAQTFLANFGHILSAPAGTDRIKGVVLSLAFEGKLIAHSGANVDGLLSSFEDLENKGKRKRSPSDRPLIGYHSIPSHWRWVTLDRIGHVWGQKKPTSDFTYIDISSIDNKRGVISESPSIVTASAAPSRARKIVKKGTVIYSTVRPYLRNIAIVDQDFEPEPIASTAFAILHPFEGIEAEYVYYYLRSPAFVTYVQSVQSGIAYPAITDKRFFMGAVPIAPTEEQKLIVAKVNELMRLCDKLETQQKDLERCFPVLSRAIHARFAESPTPAKLKCIFDVPRMVSPDDLRKTMLTLAVRGKLVPQKTYEESAKVLLESIRAKKAQSIDSANSRYNRKSKPLRKISDSEKAFPLPAGWEWGRLGDVSLRIGSGSTPRGGRNAYVLKGIPFLRSQNIWNHGIRLDDVAYIPETTHERMSNTKVFPGDILLNITGASLGRCSVVHDEPKEANVSQHVSIIRPVEEAMRFYLHLVMLSPYAQDLIWTRQVGMAREGLSKKVLELFEIPIPPLAEQQRIVAKVDQLMALVDQMEKQQNRKTKIAEAFAKAVVSAITGTEIKEQEKMKVPETELVSQLKIKNRPKGTGEAPLADIVAKHKGELSAKALWQESGLEIDAFYQQLKIEMVNGWIVEPEKAFMREVGTD
jgi:type I restriction enzyme, S subunit